MADQAKGTKTLHNGILTPTVGKPVTRLTEESGTDAMYKSSYIGSGGKNAGCKPDKLCRHEFLLCT